MKEASLRLKLLTKVLSKSKNEPKSEPKSEPKRGNNGEQRALKKVLDLIARKPSITTIELMEKSGKSRTTIQKYIRILKENHSIVRVGANKGGYWEVID